MSTVTPPRGQPTSSRSGGDLDIALIGALVSDGARCQMLLALADGGSLSATRLAEVGGVSPATASSHLGKMTAAGLLRVDIDGRHRYYRLSSSVVLNLLVALEHLAPGLRVVPDADEVVDGLAAG
jgi:DNA-binding transcriptional ArsR family regulator